ncbi:MAG: hypothetical protein EOO38_21705 [Cytophagaceae bacterium]|nr:MAG: hypothetical protein EOO38_21705 [Cytophagaceae bacterium]
MPSNDFDQFVSGLQANKESQKEFWTRQRDEYIADVDSLYGHIEKFLEPWTSNGSIAIEYHPQSIHEEDTGPYEVRKCIILIGNRSVALTPVGTQLIGTKGRIEISGASGRSRLMLVDAASPGPRVLVTMSNPRRQEKKQADPQPEQDIAWTWKIVSNPPDLKFIDFNRDNFLDLIMGITNG